MCVPGVYEEERDMTASTLQCRGPLRLAGYPRMGRGKRPKEETTTVLRLVREKEPEGGYRSRAEQAACGRIDLQDSPVRGRSAQRGSDGVSLPHRQGRRAAGNRLPLMGNVATRRRRNWDRTGTDLKKSESATL